MFTCVLGRCVASTVLLVPKTFRRALTASVNSCAGSLEEGAGKRCSVPESDAGNVTRIQLGHTDTDPEDLPPQMLWKFLIQCCFTSTLRARVAL